MRQRAADFASRTLVLLELLLAGHGGLGRQLGTVQWHAGGGTHATTQRQPQQPQQGQQPEQTNDLSMADPSKHWSAADLSMVDPSVTTEAIRGSSVHTDVTLIGSATAGTHCAQIALAACS